MNLNYVFNSLSVLVLTLSTGVALTAMFPANQGDYQISVNNIIHKQILR